MHTYSTFHLFSIYATDVKTGCFCKIWTYLLQDKVESLNQLLFKHHFIWKVCYNVLRWLLFFVSFPLSTSYNHFLVLIFFFPLIQIPITFIALCTIAKGQENWNQETETEHALTVMCQLLTQSGIRSMWSSPYPTQPPGWPCSLCVFFLIKTHTYISLILMGWLQG